MYAVLNGQEWVIHSLGLCVRPIDTHSLPSRDMVEMQKEEGNNLLLWDAYTVHQIYDTETDENWYFLRLKFKSQSSLGPLHNSAQRSCSLREAIHFGGLCNAYSNEVWYLWSIMHGQVSVSITEHSNIQSLEVLVEMRNENILLRNNSWPNQSGQQSKAYKKPCLNARRVKSA